MLRALDTYLVRRWPNLWALKLPTLLVPMAGLSLIAYVVARLTPVELDNVPDVETTVFVWVLFSLVPLGYWVVEILRVRHPPRKRGVALRGLLVIGPTLACASSVGPAAIYVLALEQQIEDTVRPVEEEILLYDRVKTFYESELGPSEEIDLYTVFTRIELRVHQSPVPKEAVVNRCWRAFRNYNARLDLYSDVTPELVGTREIPLVDADMRGEVDWYQSECKMMPDLWGVELETESIFVFDEVKPGIVRIVLDRGLVENAWNPDVLVRFEEEVSARTEATSKAWGRPWASRLTPDDPVRLRSYMLAHDIAHYGSAVFGYDLLVYFTLALVAYLAYGLHFARYGNAAMFGVAVIVYAVLIGSAWALSTIEGSFVRVVPITNYAILLAAPFAFLAYRRVGKRAFLFELWLCSVPLLGLSVILWLEPGSVYPLTLMRYTAIGCGAALALVPGLHLVAERYRSLPA